MQERERGSGRGQGRVSRGRMGEEEEDGGEVEGREGGSLHGAQIDPIGFWSYIKRAPG